MQLKSSKFFTTFFNIKKLNNQKKDEDEIFKETEEDFIKLKFFFKPNWINIFDDSLIIHCYQALKYMNYYQILNELKILKDYFDMKEIDDNYLNTIVNEIISFQNEYKYENQNFVNKIKINKEIINLKNELNYKNKIIEQQKIEIEKLKNQLNNINNLFNNAQKINEQLQNNINTKENELLSLKNKLNYKIEELNQIKLDYNIENNNIIHDNEVSFAINFISDNQDIIYPMKCKPSDLISRLEEQLYNEYPKYKDINTYLTVNGEVIKRFKTIEDNKIHKGNVIIVNKYE